MPIEQIEVTVQGRTEQMQLAIRWAGGYISKHALVRTVQRYEQLADYPRLCARIEELLEQGKTMAEVAGCLNAEGFHPPKRVERFTGGMVAGFWARQEEPGSTVPSLSKGEWLLGDLARHLGMPLATLHRWRKGGWLVARQRGDGR